MVLIVKATNEDLQEVEKVDDENKEEVKEEK